MCTIFCSQILTGSDHLGDPGENVRINKIRNLEKYRCGDVDSIPYYGWEWNELLFPKLCLPLSGFSQFLSLSFRYELKKATRYATNVHKLGAESAFSVKFKVIIITFKFIHVSANKRVVQCEERNCMRPNSKSGISGSVLVSLRRRCGSKVDKTISFSCLMPTSAENPNSRVYEVGNGRR
jgi:hypothetical protein